MSTITMRPVQNGNVFLRLNRGVKRYDKMFHKKNDLRKLEMPELNSASLTSSGERRGEEITMSREKALDLRAKFLEMQFKLAAPEDKPAIQARLIEVSEIQKEGGSTTQPDTSRKVMAIFRAAK